MKTVWRALTLMADSVHYFSHNVAFFFFFFLSTWNYLYQDTVTHTFTAHLFTTRKDLSQKYTIRTSNSDTCIAAFSFFLSRPCYSFFSLLFDKVNILCKQRGKTGNITKYVCLSDNNRSIRLRTAHTVGLEAVVTTFCPTQNNLNNNFLAENLSAMELLESPVSVWSLHIDQLSRWIDSYTPTIDDAQLASQSYTGRKCWRLSLSST